MRDYVTVKQLIELLKKQDEEAFIATSIDPEGNGYNFMLNPASVYDSFVNPEFVYYGRFDDPISVNWDENAKDIYEGDKEKWQKDKEDGIKVVILYP